jgi:hypothetical protein
VERLVHEVDEEERLKFVEFLQPKGAQLGFVAVERAG